MAKKKIGPAPKLKTIKIKRERVTPVRLRKPKPFTFNEPFAGYNEITKILKKYELL